VVESLVEEPDFELLPLLSDDVELLLVDDGVDSDDEAEPGVVDDGVDCAPEELSVLDCVPYGDL